MFSITRWAWKSILVPFLWRSLKKRFCEWPWDSAANTYEGLKDPTMRTATRTSKNNTFYKQNNNFARASRSFVHFFTRFCTTTMWKFLISRFMEYVNKQRRNVVLFLNLDIVPRNLTPGGFAYIWQSKWFGIIAIKTERTQIHFLVAVASLNLKVPIDETTIL